MTQAPLTMLSEEETMFFNTIKEFALKTIEPKVEHMDETQAVDESIVKECFKLGIMGIETPETYQGSGGSFFNAVLTIEALAQVDPSISVLVDVQNTLVTNAFLKWGSEEVKKRYLPRLATELVGSYCLTEPESGSDAFALKTRAEDKGDHYLINGRKLFITNGMESSVFIVFANVNFELGYKGITAFIVEKGMPGFKVARKENKLGIRASSTCELVFDDVAVPKSNILGEVGKGYKIAIETLDEGRIGIAAQMLGLAEGAFAKAKAYVEERKQFGKALCDFQAIQFDFARMATKIEAAKLLVYNAARLKDAKKEFVKEACMAKIFASETAEYVASLSLEMFGGYGFIKDYRIEKFYRDAKIGKIYEGTSNMQLQTISKLIFGS
jgi:alkylation response protein AidB-like acyl-CoA dehydrogenase